MDSPKPSLSFLDHLLDSWATCTTTTWHATLWHSTATCSLVDLHHDWVDDAFKLLLLSLKLILLSQLVLVEPIEGLLHCLLDLLFVIALELILKLLLRERITQAEAVVLKTILGFNLLLGRLVLRAELLGLLHHTIDFRLRKTTLLVGDSDLVGLTCGLVLG